MSKLLTEKEKQEIIQLIKKTNIRNDDSVFDLGKSLRDYGFMLMARVIKKE